MKKSIVVIDDEEMQANSLAKVLGRKLPNALIRSVSKENEIMPFIENQFYNIAIVDLRMDEYNFNGISIIKKIIEINPFAKIIIVSAFTAEYVKTFQEFFSTGRILAVIEKKEFDEFVNEILQSIDSFQDYLGSESTQISKSLLNKYTEIKLEDNTFNKGVMFEDFVVLLMGTMGFLNITKRVIDKSRNEVDLVIRNEIKDPFFNKFSPYILIECKNKPETNVGKNDFIQFNTKLQNTKGMSSLGFLITSGQIAKTTYIEAVRSSNKSEKIIFISNIEIIKLISSENKIEELKHIIDSQVKDN